MDLAQLIQAERKDLTTGLGLSAGPFGPVVTTTYQERVPSELRGRFFSTMLALDNLATPAAILATGFLLDLVRFEAVIVVIGALAMGITGILITRPALHDLDKEGASL